MKFASAVGAMLLILVGVSAFAAGLTDADYGYLLDHWGMRKDGTVAKNLTAGEQAKLHELINDPANKAYPGTIENQVADFLFRIETCYNWIEERRPGPCPNAPSAADPPGKRVAQRSCNSCHLVGSAEAPSFFQLARSGGWTAQRLGTVVRAGHYMSPITLSDAELTELADYIASLR